MAVIEDEEVPSYPVPQARMQQFQANSMAAGAGGVPSGGPLSQGATQAQPAAAGPLSTSPYGLGGGYAQLYARAQQEAQERQKMQQAYLASLQQQEGALGQQGMSDYDKASMLFQAAGALGKTTRSGGFGETLGNLGEAMAGPLSKEAEKQRARAQQLQQLQLARQKLGMEMAGTGQPSVSDTLALMKAQQEAETGKGAETFKREDVDGKPVMVGSRGTIKPFDYKAAGIDPTEQKPEEALVPPDIKAMGKDAVKKYTERLATKMADTLDAAEAGAERAKRIQPILDRAYDAYNNLSKLDAIGPIQGKKDGLMRQGAAIFGTKAEEERQRYEQAAAELQAFKSELLKGQGAVTDFERRLLASTLPDLAAINAKPGLETFGFLKSDIENTIKKPERFRTRGGEQSQPSNIVPWGSLKK
jgi:hypothetical protein